VTAFAGGWACLPALLIQVIVTFFAHVHDRLFLQFAQALHFSKGLGLLGEKTVAGQTINQDRLMPTMGEGDRPLASTAHDHRLRPLIVSGHGATRRQKNAAYNYCTDKSTGFHVYLLLALVIIKLSFRHL
jgi:hypothetical protein